MLKSMIAGSYSKCVFSLNNYQIVFPKWLYHLTLFGNIMLAHLLPVPFIRTSPWKVGDYAFLLLYPKHLEQHLALKYWLEEGCPDSSHLNNLDLNYQTAMQNENLTFSPISILTFLPFHPHLMSQLLHLVVPLWWPGCFPPPPWASLSSYWPSGYSSCVAWHLF